MDYNRFLDIDYKHRRNQSSHHRLPAFLLLLLLFCSVAIGAAVVSSAGKRSDDLVSAAIQTESLPLAQLDSATHELNSEDQSNNLPVVDSSESISETEVLNHFAAEAIDALDEHGPESKTITVKSGDTLGTIFSSLDIYRELHPLLAAHKGERDLKSIRPGQKLHFHFDNEQFVGLDVEKSVNQHVAVRKQADGYHLEHVTRPFEKRLQVATGTINNSLFLAGQRAGMSDALIMELAGIFGWDIDFALDIRAGDQFTVMYEENYLDGEKASDGRIVAAEFVNDGNKFRAIEYTDSTGKSDYYDPSGKSMRKPFLRTPVDFARISSRFNLKRKHPILNKIRAHRGVDYAASTGTPIKASGDGKIVHRGTKGGYGRTIIIKHGSTYSTLYAHMSKYARNTGNGARVKQGQIIGYVGKSGLATGPHLHYEFLVNGVHRNPLTVKLPAAQPLPKSEMPRFKQSIQEVLAKLDTFSTIQLASTAAE